MLGFVTDRHGGEYTRVPSGLPFVCAAAWASQSLLCGVSARAQSPDVVVVVVFLFASPSSRPVAVVDALRPPSSAVVVSASLRPRGCLSRLVVVAGS
jgi:hypothetical protein